MEIALIFGFAKYFFIHDQHLTSALLHIEFKTHFIALCRRLQDAADIYLYFLLLFCLLYKKLIF